MQREKVQVGSHKIRCSGFDQLRLRLVGVNRGEIGRWRILEKNFFCCVTLFGRVSRFVAELACDWSLMVIGVELSLTVSIPILIMILILTIMTSPLLIPILVV